MSCSTSASPLIGAMKTQPPASHYIDGKHDEGVPGTDFESYYPATGEVIARLQTANRETVDRAVASAKCGLAEWSALSGAERGRVLIRAATIIRSRNDELARLESLDTGKPIRETTVSDLATAADALEYFGGMASNISGEFGAIGDNFFYTRREPLGVCAGIGAWNYPIQAAAWKAAPALACGNALVFKPSENTPLSALKLADIFTEAGLPAGAFNVVQGFADTGQMLVRHPDIAKISLTGSVSTGKAIMTDASEQLKHLTLELGGKSPLIVFDDADLESAIGGALIGNFYASGQICSNGTRVFVQRGIFERFRSRLIERTSGIRIGDPLDPKTQMGPLISREHMRRVLDYIRIGKDEGADLLYGGGAVDVPGFPGGNFVEPTIFGNLRDDMTIACEEIFGPVLSLLVFDTEDEVIRRANATNFGLAAGLFTKDLTRAHRVVSRLQVGVCWVNTYNVYRSEMPFGGYKQSGIGRESGRSGIDAYSQIKSAYFEMGDTPASF